MKIKSSTLDFFDVILEKKEIISIIVVILGFLFGTILILIVGKNPAGMYSSIWQAITGYNNTKSTMNIRYIGETLNYMVPFVLTGLSVAFAYKSGLFNIGAEGQYIIGLTAACVFAFYGPKVPFIHPLFCIVMAIIFSGLYGALVGYLKAKFEVSEVVATIMLNYIALYSSRLIMFKLPGATTYKTADFPQTALLKSDFLYKIFNHSTINSGIYIMIAVCVFYWFIMEKTSLGYEFKATGYNKSASLAFGMPINKSIIFSMAISGALAGLAGAIVGLGSFWYGRVLTGMDKYGFNGIAVALIGNCETIGIVLAGYLFGVLKNAQSIMQTRDIPKEIANIIQGIIVVFIALRSFAAILRAQISKMKVKNTSEEEKKA